MTTASIQEVHDSGGADKSLITPVILTGFIAVGVVIPLFIILQGFPSPLDFGTFPSYIM